MAAHALALLCAGLYEGSSRVERLLPCPRPLGAIHALAQFYAPWSPHSRAFAPVYVALASTPSLFGLRMVAVDCSEEANEGCCADLNITSYPSLFLLGGRRGRLAYRGEKTESMIGTWLRTNAHLWSEPSRGEAIGPGGGEKNAGEGEREAGAEEGRRGGIESVDVELENVEESGFTPFFRAPSVSRADASTVLCGARESLLGVGSRLREDAGLDEAALLELMQGDGAIAQREGGFLPPPCNVRRTLLNWLLALELGLPRELGAAVSSISRVRQWMLAELVGAPSEEQWTRALAHFGVESWPSTSPSCPSSNEPLRTNCSLWVLFHSLTSHASNDAALSTLRAITDYTSLFHTPEPPPSLPPFKLDDEFFGSPRDQITLWMWRSHNQVNLELSTLQASTRPFSSCRLSISATRGNSFLELSAVRFHGLNGTALPIARASMQQDLDNKRCRSPPGMGVSSLVDGSLQSKWFCRVGDADVHLVFTTPAIVVSYELITADDFTDRDPTSWDLKCRSGRSQPFVKQHEAHSKQQDLRQESFGLMEILPELHRFESLKEEWPPSQLCRECRAEPAAHRGRHGLRRDHTQSAWHPSAVVAFLHRTYCLESQFECWREKESFSPRWRRPSNNKLASAGLVIGALLMLWLCLLAWIRDQRDQIMKVKLKTAEDMA